MATFTPLSTASPTRASLRSPIRPRPSRKGLSEEQVLSLRDTFSLFDTDNTGIINLKALSSDMKAMGLQSKQPVVVWLISELATTSNQMNFEQFLAGFEGKVVNSESREAAEKLFETLDDEKKGSLQAAKVQKVAKELGETLTEGEARELVKRSGANGEEITREDFCRLMGKMTL